MNEARLLCITELHELVASNRLELPNVQRGFVWKPSQIENLWDSLLRRFPSGAIITSPLGENKYQLLDGQQRATSIVLGFADLQQEAEEETDVLRSSTKDIRIFIDMRKPKPEEEGKEYVFRVITRSHPWGYQHTDNTKPLEANNRSKALKLWGKHDPFAEGVLESAYPWDAIGPLPLNFFTRAALQGTGVEKLEQDLLRWTRKHAPGTNETTISRWLEDHRHRENNKPRSDETHYSIEEIFEKVKTFVSEYAVPMLPLPQDILSAGSAAAVSTKQDAQSNLDDNDEKDDGDEIEQVFVRLNSGGTPLSGEELNYSIIKAKIGRDFQQQIEDGCKGIMKPARFITIAFRLYQKSKQEDSINLRIKPKQFQREMRKNVDDFVTFMDEEILEAELLEKVRSTLKYGENMSGYDTSVGDYRLPYPLFLKIASASQGEIMFMLMYRLLFGHNGKPDSFRYGTDEHRRMIGIILMFMWHGKDARGRHNKLLEKIWECVKNFPFSRMWSVALVGEAKGDNELKAIPRDSSFLNTIRKVRRTTKIWDKCTESGFGEFVDNVMCNRDLLLWIQRKFLSTNSFFREELFRLDDTDVPFDWDHISANNYIKGKHQPPIPLKDIYQQPCNFRVWPYRLNREDQDAVPATKFSVRDTDDDSQVRSAFSGRNESEIAAYLLENSFCSKAWKDFDAEWLEGKKISEDHWQKVYGLIFERWKNMYKELSREFRLKDLAIK